MIFKYEITERPGNLGGGYHLKFFEDGEEVGGCVFPLSEYGDISADSASSLAYENALEEASFWLMRNNVR